MRKIPLRAFQFFVWKYRYKPHVTCLYPSDLQQSVALHAYDNRQLSRMSMTNFRASSGTVLARTSQSAVLMGTDPFSSKAWSYLVCNVHSSQYFITLLNSFNAASVNLITVIVVFVIFIGFWCHQPGKKVMEHCKY